MKVHVATLDDMEGIIAVAKMNKYTKGAANPHYLGPGAFAKGWVGVTKTTKGTITGFVVVRHLIRDTYTSLYYVGVDPSRQGRGAGWSLVRWALATSPHGRVRLICEHTNEESTGWYLRHGFTQTGDGANKGGVPYGIFEVKTGELA